MVLVSIVLRVYFGQEVREIILGKMESKRKGMWIHQVSREHKEEIPNSAGGEGKGKEVRKQIMHYIRAKVTKRILKPRHRSNSF